MGKNGSVSERQIIIRRIIEGKAGFCDIGGRIEV
tara:strand:- start:411 stop:512 length:102 start_codon:yes stop_codon:yes gene_type:complete